ncbi:hypothetical protein RIN58_12645 [Siccibacter colletis]|uniref:hypothetical protein n=1 Tax=Siccibacter colletis TaxID=1505757 RepID=UPI0028BE19A8|nr:hypothetical protein [Siccibacter colletis]WNN47262.1 hypothetical protein RIN58_12645 [Siccibacter colletis]
MKQCNFLLFFALCGCSLLSYAHDSLGYGYDKEKGVIYAQKNNIELTLQFKQDYNGNPSYAFDFFNGFPAIVADSRSLHDATIYATLNTIDNEFFIDCVYSAVKSKRNGIFAKEGICGLERVSAHNYKKFLDEKKAEIVDDIDSVDTSLLLNGKKDYLPIVIFNSKGMLLYKLYKSKQALLNDEYSILALKNNGQCEVYENNPWVILNNNHPDVMEIMDEVDLDDKIELRKSVPEKNISNECSSTPAIMTKQAKNYFYDLSYHPKKSYLISGDKVNLLSMSEDNKWCRVRYVNIKNNYVDGLMLCSDLTL